MEWWSHFWSGMWEGFILPDGAPLGRSAMKAVMAALLGGVLGFEREHAGKSAGMRTHMLVSLAAAFFVMTCHYSGMQTSDLSRVVQGVATGIGFIGAGAILKGDEKNGGHVRGLTTAAGLYLATAVGVAIGLGGLIPAILVTLLGLLILTTMPKLERAVARVVKGTPPEPPQPPATPDRGPKSA
jgi:putative Mg2+ transporter-C (MgtC) family protein